VVRGNSLSRQSCVHIIPESAESNLNKKYILRGLEDHRNVKRDNHTPLGVILSLKLRFRIVVIGEMDHSFDLSALQNE
jgi:hypothetical protein